jgi:small conductance mechanosensitive channel
MENSPVELTPDMAILSGQLINLWEQTIRIAPSVLVGFVIFVTFFLLARPLSMLIIRPISYISSSLLIRNVVRRVISMFIILLGLYVFLSIVGLTQAALAIVSGTGILGIIIGFAFRDIAENFISSLLLSVQRPFRLGDVIEVQGLKGVVNKVTARGTTLIDFDGNHIQIPNATIYKNVIKNFSANPWIRGGFTIGIGYDASIQTARDTIYAVLAEQTAVLNDPEPQVLIDTLGSSTINIVVNFWIDGHKFALNKVASAVMHKTIRQLEAAGTSMPDDAREVIFPQGMPVLQVNDSGVTTQKKTDTSAESAPLIKDKTHVDTEQLESDTQDIIDQAKHSRDPEEGQNII